MTAEEVAAAIRSGEMVRKIHTFPIPYPCHRVTCLSDDLLPAGKFLIGSVLSILLYVLATFTRRSIPSPCRSSISACSLDDPFL